MSLGLWRVTLESLPWRMGDRARTETHVPKLQGQGTLLRDDACWGWGD